MRDYISKTDISKFNKSFDSSALNKISRNALTRTQIDDIAMNWEAYRKVDPHSKCCK